MYFRVWLLTSIKWWKYVDFARFFLIFSHESCIWKIQLSYTRSGAWDFHKSTQCLVFMTSVYIIVDTMLEILVYICIYTYVLIKQIYHWFGLIVIRNLFFGHTQYIKTHTFAHVLFTFPSVASTVPWLHIIFSRPLVWKKLFFCSARIRNSHTSIGTFVELVNQGWPVSKRVSRYTLHGIQCTIYLSTEHSQRM